jgi:DNA-binding LacI/PurR family transcriptional regulator
MEYSAVGPPLEWRRQVSRSVHITTLKGATIVAVPTAGQETRRATINDVARLAGVSRSTVSNALNHRRGRLAKETADRIQDAAKALRYVPDGLARQLRRGHADTIGLIVPSVANPFWGEFVRAVEEAALRRNFSVLVGSSDRSLERERAYMETMYQQGIRTMVFGSSPVSVDHLAAAAELGLFIVAFDRRLYKGDSARIDCISVDNIRGSAMAVQALLDLGHRRIGFISGPIKTASRKDRFAGYRSTLATAGIKLDRNWVWEGSKESAFGDAEGAELGRAGAFALVTQQDPVTAIVAINDMYALGAYAGARTAGLRVPDDVSIVGFDDIVFASLIEPALTTVRQPVRLMAEAAVDRLVVRLREGEEGAPLRMEFLPELVMRASTAPPPASKAASARPNGVRRRPGGFPAAKRGSRDG